eukprot:TRINITY_DN32955_c0_g1_i1.p1 TRINITY_DN32955_c0_g1~~TRINITY_DN32955_c0_g1_i1.p1  ORF type:complete len:532 (+),score=107.03 TRINITY_DN32955_c0_g1_i1:131-1726(+)
MDVPAAPGMVAQEATHAWTPRDGEPSVSSDLARILKDLMKEKTIFPSRRFLRMVHEEAHAAKLRGEMEANEEQGSLMNPSVSTQLSHLSVHSDKPALLTRMVADVSEYCKIKFLDDDLPQLSVSEAAADDLSPTLSDLPFQRSCSAKSSKGARMHILMERCAETYSLLLLTRMDDMPRDRSRSHKGSSPERTTESKRSDDDFDRLAGYTTRAGAEKGATTGAFGTTLGGREDSSLRTKTGKLPEGAPTPFFESVYALVSRAVLQGLKASIEDSQQMQGKRAAEVCAQVEEELSRLFRSKEFGCGSARGLRKGATTVEGHGSGAEVESAQLAARVEEELGKLLKQLSKSKQHWSQEFYQLEVRLPRHAQEEANKQNAETADKGGAGALLPGDSKDGGAAGDHAATAASVDALIAGFKSRASPRRRLAEQHVSLHNTMSSRSPIMAAKLPSAVDQLQVMQEHQRLSLSQNRRAAETAGVTPRSCSDGLSPTKSTTLQMTGGSSLMNSWALSHKRTTHKPFLSSDALAPPKFLK